MTTTRSASRRAPEESAGGAQSVSLGPFDSTPSTTDSQQRIQSLEAQVRELQANVARQTVEAGTPAPVPTPRREGSTFSGVSDAPLAPKTIRPDKMRPYRGTSEGEHIRWFGDVELKFLLSPEYFTNDRSKILYCAQSLEEDAARQWQLFFKPEKVNDYTFSEFKAFLLDLVADPTNRRLLAHEKWNYARQAKDQKATAFRAQLEELEANLEPLPDGFRAAIFLSKLRQDIKERILGTGNVPTSREDILALASMQERVLERHHIHLNKPKDKDKGKSLEERTSRPPGQSASSEPSAKRFKGNKDRDNQKSKSNSNTPNKSEQKSDACFICGGKGHWKKDCPQKDNPNFTPVNSVQSKNDNAPPRDQRRGQKEKNKDK